MYDLNDPSDSEKVLECTVPEGGVTVLIFFSVAVESSKDSKENAAAYMAEHDPENVIGKVYYNPEGNSAASWYESLVRQKGNMAGVTYWSDSNLYTPYVMLIVEDVFTGTEYIEWYFGSWSGNKAADVNGVIAHIIDTIVSVTVPGTERYDFAREVFDKVNTERENVGAGELTLSGRLTAPAMQRAAELAVYYDHTRPNRDGALSVNGESINGTPVTYEGLAAENIAVDQAGPEEAMSTWMVSAAGDKENILNTNYTQVGVGCFENNGTLYWVQLFGSGDDETSPTETGSVAADVAVETYTSRLALSLTSSSFISMEAGQEIAAPKLLNANQGYHGAFAVLKPIIEAYPFETSDFETSEGAAGTGEVRIKAVNPTTRKLVYINSYERA